MSLKIKKRSKDATVILKLMGDATSEDICKLSKALEEIREKGTLQIAIDVAEASFLDSSALGVLILNFKILARNKGTISILHPTSYMRQLLTNSNLDTVFPLVEREDDL